MSQPTTNCGLCIRPEPGVWRTWLGSDRFTPSEAQRRFRTQLSLPTDRPVVMTGHQAIIWHPGILAKYLAAEAAADQTGAGAAWLVVDHDTSDPFAVRYPAFVERAGRRELVSETWRVDGEASPLGERSPEVPVSAIAPVSKVARPATDAASADVARGLEEISAALTAHAGARSAAEQVTGALRDLLADLVRPAPVVFASRLAQTDLFAEWIARMANDAALCCGVYNRAVAAHPHARVALLVKDEQRGWELPLWLIDGASGRRARVFESMIRDGSARKALLPRLRARALAMTAMVRSAGCDLFIHGTGGAGSAGAAAAGVRESEGYEAITQEWITGWLGEGSRLAPIAMVTATLRLEITTAQPPITPQQIARARWTAHAARHHPLLVGDAGAEEQRAGIVLELSRLRRKRDAESRLARAAAYKRLHGLLAEARRRHAPDLSKLEAKATAAALRQSEAMVLADRTWAFPLYQRAQLQRMRAELRRAFP